MGINTANFNNINLDNNFDEDDPHCVKSVQIRSFLWSLFFCIRTEYGDLRSPYSVKI